MTPMCLPVASTASPASKSSSNGTIDADSSHTENLQPDAELSEPQKLICKKLNRVFQGDLSKVSSAMGVSQGSISQQVELDPFQFSKIASSPTNEGRNKNNKSNSYNPAWTKHIVETKNHPFFYPCHHTEPCSATTCSCIQNGFFCTKACIWGSSSRNFFRGCNCTGKCMAKNCPCFASNRECDPDLCKRCGTCSDPANQAATAQACRNDTMGMRRHEHLLMGKSEIAGWGLFTKRALKKGEYIHEVSHSIDERSLQYFVAF
jgi:hypothetical protein